MIIVTGYYGDKQPLFQRWYNHLIKQVPEDTTIHVINAGSYPLSGYPKTEWHNMKHNLGHVEKMNPSQQLCGWSMAFLMGCMIAYHEQQDMIFVENDCFAFGDWINTLYRDAGDKQMVIGQINTGGNPMGDCTGLQAQGLVLVKKDILLQFVKEYLAYDITDKFVNPEHKMARLIPKLPIAVTSMGYDRSRPYNKNDKAFYVQQCSEVELKDLGV